MTTELVVDRSRITHGESKRMTLIGIRLQKAQNALDLDAAGAALDDLDTTLAKIVVSVPDDWLPEGVKVGDAAWLDALSQDHYDAVLGAANPTPEKKER